MNELELNEQNTVAEFHVTEKDGIQSISARELHQRLEIQTAFKDWFPRICDYGFAEGLDFNPLKIEQVRLEGNREVKRELTDYAISIEMAKQICMLQRSELGKRYREYFLKLEKAWNSPEAIMARALQVANRTLEQVTKRALIAESALNRIANGKGCFTMNQTAKALKLPYGNIKLYEKLRNEGILNRDNSPKQEQVNAGHFKVVMKYVSESVGNKPVTLTTSKGLVYLARKFKWEIDESIKADAE